MLSFLKDAPKTQDKLIQIVENVRNWVFHKFNIVDTQQVVSIKDSFKNVFSQLLSSFGNNFLSFVESLVSFVFFLIFTYFILVSRKQLVKFVLAFFSSAQKPRVKIVIDNTRHVIINYVMGLLIEMVIMFTLILAVLLILGVQYALLIAVVAALLNVIPYIGIYIATAFGMLITLTESSGGLSLAVGITFLAVHLLDASFVMLKVVGGRVRINPLITLVAVITGNLIWGIPGMFLFIPLTAIIRIISENISELRPWAILIGDGKVVDKKSGHLVVED